MRTFNRSQLHASRVSLTLLALALAGCASSAGLVNMWKDPEYGPAPLHKVYVIVAKKDPAHRRLTEDAFVSALAKRGISATPSYRDFNDAIPDTDQVAQIMESGGYDGAISVMRLETETTENYVPGYVTTQPETHWNPYRQRYYTYYRDVVSPGYVETNQVVRHRVDVWTPAQGGRLIWTAVTTSVNPGSLTDINRDMVDRVVPELVDKGILPKNG